MTNQIFSDEDPENNDELEQQNQSSPTQPISSDLPSISAFDLSDSDEIDEVRQALSEMKTNIDHGNSGDEQNISQGQIFSPFNDDDFDPTVEPVSLSPVKLDNNPVQNLLDSKQALAFNQIDSNDSHNDEIFQRINVLESTNNTQTGSNPNSITPPFLTEDGFGMNENNDSLTNKIRMGQVPPESLQLLITSRMSEAEVISVSKELGIDWNLTPGTTREEKTEFLVAFFKNNLIDQNREVFQEINKPQFTIRNTEEDWRESDSRLQALQESLDLPVAPTVTTKVHFITHLLDEFRQSSILAKGLMIGLSIFAVILSLVIIYYLVPQKKVSPVPTNTPVSIQLPYPTNIQLPGGWAIDLKIGSVQTGSWNPASAEWLQGTEICRLVSIPWNKELDAVFRTFTPGDEILLTMSNNDLLNYKVEAIRTINFDELNQLINRDSPCLIVVLTQLEVDTRLATIASPGFSSKTKPSMETITVPSLSSTQVAKTATPIQIPEITSQPPTP